MSDTKIIAHKLEDLDTQIRIYIEDHRRKPGRDPHDIAMFHAIRNDLLSTLCWIYREQRDESAKIRRRAKRGD